MLEEHINTLNHNIDFLNPSVLLPQARAFNIHLGLLGY